MEDYLLNDFFFDIINLSKMKNIGHGFGIIEFVFDRNLGIHFVNEVLKF